MAALNVGDADLQNDILQAQIDASVNWLSGAKLYDGSTVGGDDLDAGNGKSVLLVDGQTHIDGGNSNDVLVADNGDVIMTGGNGSDLFVFSFNVTAGSSSTINFNDGIRQNDFVNQYNAFLEANGFDPDIPGTWDQNSSTDPVPGNNDPTVESVWVQTGNPNEPNLHLRHYENTVGTAGSVTGVGDATINDFKSNDFILMRGITKEDAADLFHVTDGATGTVITWDGGDGSITLLGAHYSDLNALLNDPRVLWDHTPESV